MKGGEREYDVRRVVVRMRGLQSFYMIFSLNRITFEMLSKHYIGFSHGNMIRAITDEVWQKENMFAREELTS